MQCKDARSLWQPMCDNELSEQMLDDVRGHISKCADCTRWDADMRALEEALEVAGEERLEAPPFMATRIMARLGEQKASWPARLLGWLAPPRLAFATAVAAAFALGLFARDMNMLTPVGGELVARTVVIEYEAPEAMEVGLVGDFNQWGRREVPIESRRVDGKWVFELELAPGRYQYALVVNGKKWLPDPSAKGIIPDGFGGMNSIVYVKGSGGDATL